MKRDVLHPPLQTPQAQGPLISQVHLALSPDGGMKSVSEVEAVILLSSVEVARVVRVPSQSGVSMYFQEVKLASTCHDLR